jgi:hypothetical protein
LNIIDEFVNKERNNYSGNKEYLFTHSLLYQASENYEYLNIIERRYKKESDLFRIFIEDKQYSKMHEPIERIINTWMLHLDIESYYIFSKILLDKMAAFIEHYFGKVSKASIYSHDKFTRNYNKYYKALSLLVPEGFTDTVLEIRNEIINYRDKQIIHIKNPRERKGTLYSSKGAIIIPTWTDISRGEIDKEITECLEISEVKIKIDKYLSILFELISINRDKCIYCENN